MNIQKEKGFTLVELLVVVSIIGLLSTLAVVALGSARVKARDAKRVSDVRQIQTALELHFSDNNAYPASAGGDAVLGSDANFRALTNNGFKAAGDPSTETVYMSKVPANPQPGGADYVYHAFSDLGRTTDCPANATNCASYTLTFGLEGDGTDLASGAHTATPEGIN